VIDMNALSSKLALAVAMAGGLALAGCATPYNNGGNYGYQGQPGGQGRNVRCNTCGVVQEVQQVYTQGNSSGGTLGAVIGAVAGGVLGNQVGKGDGRKAATVAGAVAGGVVGNQVGKRSGSLDNGQYATVTQRENPDVRNGDYVQVRGDHVYRL
jgi:outer membrane lipoprotein SlyB